MRRILVIAASALLLASCATSVAPLRDQPGTPPVVANGIDERCYTSYPELPATEPQLESELLLRPPQWPEAPAFAVLCWSVVDGDQETAYYATDPGVTADHIFSHYEKRFGDNNIFDRVESDTGTLLTGVFAPAHSYYIDHDPAWDAYTITWAIDGDYAD